MSENLQHGSAGGLILGIESSCDDSSVALLDIETLELKFHKKISQDAEHCAFGGVVPELAARLHTAALPKILEQIKPELPRVKAVAVTNEPGLSVSLVGGVAMAKALASSLRVPLIAVNHLAGHVYSLFLSQEARLPAGVLLVSGGHT
ncbi:UGMP family protein, partial [Campylobacter showae CC57C]